MLTILPKVLRFTLLYLSEPLPVMVCGKKEEMPPVKYLRKQYNDFPNIRPM